MDDLTAMAVLSAITVVLLIAFRLHGEPDETHEREDDPR